MKKTFFKRRMNWNWKRNRRLLAQQQQASKQAVASTTQVLRHQCWSKKYFSNHYICMACLHIYETSCVVTRIAYKCDASLKKWQDFVLFSTTETAFHSSLSSSTGCCVFQISGPIRGGLRWVIEEYNNKREKRPKKSVKRNNKKGRPPMRPGLSDEDKLEKKTLVAQDGREFLLCLFTERSTDMTDMR